MSKVKKFIAAALSCLLLLISSGAAAPGRILSGFDVSASAASTLPAPANIWFMAFTDRVTLMWDEVPGAKEYRVKIYVPSEKTYKTYSDVYDRKCTVWGLEKNTTYYFAVASLAHKWEGSTLYAYEQECSKAITAKTASGEKDSYKSTFKDSPKKDFIYWETKDGKGIQIEGYTGNDACVGIPAKFEGKPVTVIKEDAFYSKRGIFEVRIPDTVKTIEKNAFRSCDHLSYVNIPKSIKTIGEYAFDNCTYLSSLTFPDGLKTIGEHAFDNCRNLVSVSLPDSVTTIGKSALRLCGLEKIKLPDKLTVLNEYVLADNFNLTKITIPKSVKEIKEYAFYSCRALKSVTVPGSVKTIGYRAFYFCKSLQSATLKKGVKEIESQAFAECPELVKVKLPTSIKSLSEWTFDNSPKVRPVYKGKTYNYQHIKDLCKAIKGG